MFRAHKVILAMGCEYFDTMLTAGFEEGTRDGGEPCLHFQVYRRYTALKPPCMCSAKAQPILIEETTARAFEALLHFLYSDALQVEDECLVDLLRCPLPLLCLAKCALPLQHPMVCRLADRCQVSRLYRLCLARMKAVLSPEHACYWLVEVTKHSVVELQEPLLQYVTREWGKICDENLESTRQLVECPQLQHAIMISPEQSRPTKRQRT